MHAQYVGVSVPGRKDYHSMIKLIITRNQVFDHEESTSGVPPLHSIQGHVLSVTCMSYRITLASASKAKKSHPQVGKCIRRH